jgi:hypothetical protein
MDVKNTAAFHLRTVPSMRVGRESVRRKERLVWLMENRPSDSSKVATRCSPSGRQREGGGGEAGRTKGLTAAGGGERLRPEGAAESDGRAKVVMGAGRGCRGSELARSRWHRRR